jgi:Permuted papain-like amidase enzyme, YaeF/YiiX, C92 family
MMESFLTVFGDLKVFRWPLFFLYDPGSYMVKGKDMREVINVIRPGDILLRGYVNYLDGYFIPGYFSHVGLYLGQVDPRLIESIWSEDDNYAPLDEVLKHSVSGEQMVIHSMAEGVFMEDLLNFCRCDYMIIMRFPEKLTRGESTANPFSKADDFSLEEKEVAARLEHNETLSFNQEVFPVVYKVALSQLGRNYDFRFDFSDFESLSCSEFVYYSTKCIEWYSGLCPVDKRVLFIKKRVLEPDAFVCSDKLEIVWQSASVSPEKISALRKKSAAPA